MKSTFHKKHVLYKICNRFTMKVSYSSLPYIKTEISRHNKKVLTSTENPPPTPSEGTIRAAPLSVWSCKTVGPSGSPPIRTTTSPSLSWRSSCQRKWLVSGGGADCTRWSLRICQVTVCLSSLSALTSFLFQSTSARAGPLLQGGDLLESGHLDTDRDQQQIGRQ